MTQTVKAIYEHGILKPLQKISLPEHKKVTIKILDSEQIPLKSLSLAAFKSKSFTFLKSTREDLYTLKDGKPA